MLFEPQALLTCGGGIGLTMALGHGGLRGKGALVRSVQYSHAGFATVNATLAELAGGQWALSGEEGGAEQERGLAVHYLAFQKAAPERSRSACIHASACAPTDCL